MLKICSLVPLMVIATGCASVMNDVTHPMRIETKTQAGDRIAGADCKLRNDKASSTVKSGETANVRRSSADLDIVCTHPSNPDAIARVTSRVNGSMFGNVILGGGIGAVVDHNRGTAYTYPTWVELVFGKTLTFDRKDEKEGFATPPVIEPVQKKS